jgi:chromosome segregation ATPase
MELEQINKRLEWLDDERRKDKIVIATLEERVQNMQSQFPSITQQLKDLSGELSRLTSTLSRFDQLEQLQGQVRIDLTRKLGELEKQVEDTNREREKNRLADMEVVNRNIGEMRKGLEPLPEIRKNIQARQEEDFRLARLIDEIEHKYVESQHSNEEFLRSQKLLEEGRRQDAKRLVDMQAELASLRKRLEEQRGKVDLTADSIRKFEARIVELQTAETERRQTQSTFIEKQTLVQVERDRTWREWQTRFEELMTRTADLDTHLQTLEVTNRAIKRSQEAFDEITEKFERRVNEITEMMRLSDERFRQEWTAFKGDDQKRWSNYTLVSDEQQREMNRGLAKYEDRIASLEGASKLAADLLQQVTEDTQKRLQSSLALMHNWVEEYNRSFGQMR